MIGVREEGEEEEEEEEAAVEVLLFRLLCFGLPPAAAAAAVADAKSDGVIVVCARPRFVETAETDRDAKTAGGDGRGCRG